MQNGFIYFCCHETTKIREYAKVLPPYNATDRKKMDNFFPIDYDSAYRTN